MNRPSRRRRTLRNLEQLEARTLLSVTLSNQLPASQPGHFTVDVQDGGEARNVDVTLTGQNNPVMGDVLYEYFNYVDVGADGNAVRLSATTIDQAATLLSDGSVRSTGHFSGSGATGSTGSSPRSFRPARRSSPRH